MKFSSSSIINYLQHTLLSGVFIPVGFEFGILVVGFVVFVVESFFGDVVLVVEPLVVVVEAVVVIKSIGSIVVESFIVVKAVVVKSLIKRPLKFANQKER